MRYFLLFIATAFFADTAMAQTTKWKEMHKVKRKETLFGIARDNGITVDELIEANPEMKQPDYKLKKGDYIFIPYPKANSTPLATHNDTLTASSKGGEQKRGKSDIRNRAIKVGIMLPLHYINGDGRRMVE